MELKILRQEAYDALYKDISENIAFYADRKDIWIEDYYQAKGIKLPVIDTDIEAPEIELICGQDPSNDSENAVIFYENYKNLLKPVQAADRRLWAALTHTTFYNYANTRWPVTDSVNESGTNGTVTDRYFLSRGLFRNCISRLYWIPKLTYDDSLEDPYKYTKFLFSNQDLINQVDGRSLCRNKSILKSCLMVLEAKDGLTESQKRMFFEKLCKKGGISVLDGLPEENLIDMCNGILDVVLHEAVINEGSRLTLRSLSDGRTMKCEIKHGKACVNKTVLISKPENLSRLSVGKDIEIAGIKYRIISIA
jgi:hypothetical protein